MSGAKLCRYCGNSFAKPPKYSAKQWAVTVDCSRSCSTQYRHGVPIDRFWAAVSPEPNTGCWLWAGAADRKGYGLMSSGIGRRQVPAHRFSYERFVGPIPAGLYVCHTCDVPSCVNPDHLWLGTHYDNIADATKKKRWARGARHPHSKLTDRAVWCIRHSPWSAVEAAEMHGVTPSRVRSLRAGDGWEHIQFGRSLGQ